MQQKETTHKPDQEQALQDLWLKECAEAEELQKIRGTDAFDAFMICFKLRKRTAFHFRSLKQIINASSYENGMQYVFAKLQD